MTGQIQVRGATLHNLRNLDVDLPRDALVAVTGVSGSGKSSLAFGTIHGESQRRYLDSVAPYARRLLHTAMDPQVRDVRGLPPTVALEQGRSGAGARSTVGTVTTTGSTLRMLWSRCGAYPQGAPRLDSDHFSANTAAGACPGCAGLGVVHEPTEAAMVPDPSRSIAQGAIAAWPGAWLGKNYRDIVATLGHDIDRPWRDLPEQTREWLLFTQEQPVVTVVPVRDAERINRPYQGTFSSAARYVRRTLAETKSAAARRRMMQFVQTSACPTCQGRRLRPDALAVTWHGLAIDEAGRLPVTELVAVLQEPQPLASDAVAQAQRVLLEDLVGRLDLLVDLGLGHLSLGRPATGVSAGELQRLRLATALRSGLFGVVYVLDEPSAGLHPRDVDQLVALLRALVEAGNTVIVVEHDMAVVQRCDWVVDVGPGAGRDGGELLCSGPVADLAGVEASPTATYLNAPVHPRLVLGERTDPRDPTGLLRLRGLQRHTVRGVDLDLPLGVVTVVNGISGSGKTSLLDAVHDVVGARLARVEDLPDDSDDGRGTGGDGIVAGAGPGAGTAPVTGQVSTDGDGAPQRVVRITQRPIGRTPRSTLATYTGLWDAVRKAFAATPEAKARRFGPGRFSFNTTAGQCPECTGEGAVAIELLFLPGAYARCPRCLGARFAEETLSLTWQGHTVADLLAMTVRQAREALAPIPPAARALSALDALGLGYLTLGQPATELSGGEAQRIKLATELQKQRRSATLYLFDEPTTGLHPADVHRLLAQLHALAGAGHTVLLAEHDPAAVATADHLVELGPGAGDAGGQVISSAQRH